MREHLTTPGFHTAVMAAAAVIADRDIRMSEFPGWPLPNVWLGTSVEDQTRADERIPHLLATPAAVRFLSCEPLLGAIDLTMIDLSAAEALEKEPSGLLYVDGLSGLHSDGEGGVDGVYGSPDPHIDWVICGGESGPGARPMDPVWARSLRDQCAAAGVPYFFKQWGTWAADALRFTDAQGRCPPPRMKVGKKKAGRLLDGIEHNGMPA